MAVAALVCCTKNESDAPGGKDGTESVPVVSGQSSLTAVIHDEEATDKAAVADDGAVTWSKGDALSVYDGSGFTTFTLEGNGGSGTGTFKADGIVSAQTVAIYPAGSHSLSGNNLTVNLPASYTLASVDDANTNVPMVATGDFTSGELSFKQIGGLFRFTHYTVPPAARKFVFKSEGYKINGDFVIDITASEPSLASETTSSAAESEVTVNFPAPSDTVEMNFFIPIPTGAYNNLTISLLNSSDEVIWTTTTGSASGTSTIDIARKSFKKMPAVGGIKTAEELMTLASRFNAGKAIDMYKDCKGEITLRDDIDLTGKTWTPIGNVERDDTHNIPGHEFGEVFNGRFKTIDNLVVDGTFSSQYAQSLFGVLAATAVIKNLTLGENSSITFARTSGMIRCAGIVDFARYAGAKLINLTNKANITVNATSGAKCWVGGVVADCRADVYNCKNEGDITLTTTATALNSGDSYVMGGVIGTFSSVANYTVKDLVNTGTVTNNCAAIKADVGGVIGKTTGGTVSGIINRGIVQTTAGNTRMGGLIGTCAASATYPSANSDFGFYGTLLFNYAKQGGDIGLIFGTNNAPATYSNIKVACTWGRYEDATKRYTIASQADFDSQVRKAASGSKPNTDISLKGSSTTTGYEDICNASSYGADPL